MRELAILSGKGGAGKTSLAGCLALLLAPAALADADVDASNLPLLFRPEDVREEPFHGGRGIRIREEVCDGCGTCARACRFGALSLEGGKARADLRNCEGCGFCVLVCPRKAIEPIPLLSGSVRSGHTSLGPLVWGELSPGAEHSGRLVAAVKAKARAMAREAGSPLLIVDGPPGLACPAVAAASGADGALLVVDTSLAALADSLRLLGLLASFRLSPFGAINRFDRDPEIAEAIRRAFRERNLPLLAEIPTDPAMLRAQRMGKTLTEAFPDSPGARAIRSLAEKLTARGFGGGSLPG
jgi:MinD superfamily P-loop ATPase